MTEGGGGMLPPVLYVLRASVGEFTGSMKEARTALAETKADGESKGAAIRKSVAGIGKVAAVAAIGVGAASVKMAADFQKQITLLHTAGGESTANLGLIASGIKNIATQTGTSTSQLTEGMYTVEKAGIRGAAGLNVLKAASEGAKAENVDLGTATNALTSVMMSYHLKASDAVKVENQLVAGSGMAKTSMQSYAGALSTVIPIASAAHISFAQVAGAVATLTQHGTSADEATQELANTIRNLQAPNNVAVRAMQQLGLNVNDVSGKLGKRGLTGTISLITNAIQSHLGPAGKVVVSSFYKSASASKDLQTMLSKMPPSLRKISTEFQKGKVGYKDYYTDVKKAGGQSFAMGKQFLSLTQKAQGFNNILKSGNPAQQTAAATLKKVMGGATGLNTALMLSGESSGYFRKAVTKVAAAGKNAGKNISTWAATQQTLSVKMDKVKEQVQVLALNIGTKLIPVVSKIFGFLAKHTGVLKLLAALIGTGLVVAIAAWTAAWLASPIGMITVALIAVGAAVYELYTHWSTIWGEIKRITSDVVGWVKKAFDDVVGVLKKWGPLALTALLPFIGLPLLIWQHWSKIKAFLTKAFKGAIKWLEQAGKDVVQGLLTGIEAVWRVLTGVYVKFPEWLIRKFAGAAQWLYRAGRNILTGLLRGLRAIWGDVTSWISSGIHWYINVYAGAGRWLIHAGERILNGLIDGLRAFWHYIVSFFRNIPHWVMGVFSGAGGWLYGVGKAIIQGLINGLEALAGRVGNVASSIAHKASGIVGSVASHLNPLSWDTGGWVPGSRGTAVPGVVHGGEYVLSTAMLAGAQPIPSDVANAVIGNAGKQTGSGVVASALPRTATAGPSGGGGAPIIVHVHGSVWGTKDLADTLYSEFLRRGVRVGAKQTWADYRR